MTLERRNKMQEVTPCRLQITSCKVTLFLVAGGSSCVYNISKTRTTLKRRLLLTLVIRATSWVCGSFFCFVWVAQLSCVSGCLRQRKAEEMSQRKSVNGRPSGTDGSDFSYRMVVDSSTFSFLNLFHFSLLSFAHIYIFFLIFICGFLLFSFLCWF